jgi:hypothetical protein
MSATRAPKPAAFCFEPSRRIEGIPDVVGLAYDVGALRISLKFEHREGLVSANFRATRGFRVLDEGDLTEFWDPEVRPGGWLWRITQGGWLDLERTRPAFFTGLGDQYMEFLVCIAAAEPGIEVF